MHESPAARYRRLAQECLETAKTFPKGERRTALVHMAQVWQRLADDYGEGMPRFRPTEKEQPVIQQQQQIQSKGGGKKE
jgi:hypothetical protein